MNDKLDLDDFTARRLRRHLDSTSDRVHLPAGNPRAARRLARRRMVRRRRAVAGSVAAATVGSLVVGLHQLSRVAPEQANTEQPTVDSVPGSPGFAPAVVEATLAESSPFVWKVEDPGQAGSISTGFGPASSFSGLAMSTAPGRVDPDDLMPEDTTQVVWRSDDGVIWEPTTLGSPFDRPVVETLGSGGALFALSTAPGLAATDQTTVEVAVADVDSEGWERLALPIDTGQFRENSYLTSAFEYEPASLDDGSILVAVTEHRRIDVRRLADEVGLDLDSVVVGEDGLTAPADGCGDRSPLPPPSTVVQDLPDGTAPAEESGRTAVTTTTTTTTTTTATSAAASMTPATARAIDEPAGSVPGPTTPSDGTDGCSTEMTWAELGVPEESIAAVGDLPSQFFRVDAGGRVEPLESPAPGVVLERAHGKDIAVYRPVGEGHSTEAYRFDGAGWQAVSAPSQNWMFEPVAVGAATAGWSDVEGRGIVFTRVADAGVTYSDPAALYAEGSRVSTIGGTAAAGEVVVSCVGLQQGTMPDPVDAPGGEVSEQPRPTWSIVATTDGVAFSVESVADLLGIDDSEISHVGRVASDGTQVVVAVTLVDTYDDGTPKQLTLVGTPRD